MSGRDGLPQILASYFEDDDSWRAEAACRGADPETWFPGRGDSVDAAKAVCATCPVQMPCLKYALDGCIKQGVWGGYSERERRRFPVLRPYGTRRSA